MTQKINYGHKLAEEIKKHGYSKKAICDNIEVSYFVLESRLEDGEFTVSQLEKLIKHRYLPND